LELLEFLLNLYGHISEYKITAKLRNKQNWISELNILKKAIPKMWKETLITQDSIKTQVIPKKYVFLIWL
jgi:flagellin-specific chaperone FliS